MNGKRLIQKIRLKNILSFGNVGEEIELRSLNVLVGPNGSGKSNLVDVIKLLSYLCQDEGLVTFISKSGGISEWLWKGNLEKKSAEIEILFSDGIDTVNYEINFGQYKKRILIDKEVITNVEANQRLEHKIHIGHNSMLSEPLEKFIDKDKYFAYAKTRAEFAKFSFFTDIETNRSSDIRRPQNADSLNNFLQETGGNLSLVLDDLERWDGVKERIIENLKRFNWRIENYSIEYIGDFVQLYLHETGLKKTTSAHRLSDGTLRYLCLLAILCHPEPPPLICIEEPETGLHPDILPAIAELLVEASNRTQLIVTTHSDILVSALSGVPETVLVCEKDETGTHLTRLERESLKVWLEDYTLGEVWLQGKIGGVRW